MNRLTRMSLVLIPTLVLSVVFLTTRGASGDEPTRHDSATEVMQLIQALGGSVLDGTVFSPREQGASDPDRCPNLCPGHATSRGLSLDDPQRQQQFLYLQQLDQQLADRETDEEVECCEEADCCEEEEIEIELIPAPRPAMAQRTAVIIQVKSLRAASRQLTEVADKLESDGLYQYSDEVRGMADALRISAREVSMSDDHELAECCEESDCNGTTIRAVRRTTGTLPVPSRTRAKAHAPTVLDRLIEELIQARESLHRERLSR